MTTKEIAKKAHVSEQTIRYGIAEAEQDSENYPTASRSIRERAGEKNPDYSPLEIFAILESTIKLVEEAYVRLNAGHGEARKAAG
jgi:predicted transcriptional regulator